MHLSSTSDLVTLYLRKMPPTSYISSETMVRCLAALPRLKMFVLRFETATFHSHRINPPSVTGSVLPALIDFDFKGPSKYLETLVIRIDGPLLSKIAAVYRDQVEDRQVKVV